MRNPGGGSEPKIRRKPVLKSEPLNRSKPEKELIKGGRLLLPLGAEGLAGVGYPFNDRVPVGVELKVQFCGFIPARLPARVNDEAGRCQLRMTDHLWRCNPLAPEPR